jgi:hypothetical protein
MTGNIDSNTPSTKTIFISWSTAQGMIVKSKTSVPNFLTFVRLAMGPSCILSWIWTTIISWTSSKWHTFMFNYYVRQQDDSLVFYKRNDVLCDLKTGGWGTNICSPTATAVVRRDIMALWLRFLVYQVQRTICGHTELNIRLILKCIQMTK